MRRPTNLLALLGLLALLPALALPALAQGEQPPAQPAPAVAEPSLRERATAAERRGDFAAAAELWLELVRAEPHVPDWYVRAGDCLGRVGRFNDCLDLLDGVRGRFPDVLEIPALIARTYSLKAGRLAADGVYDQNWVFALQDAARTAEAILDKHPGHQDARLIAAQALLELEETARAEIHAREAAERFPMHPGGPILLGQIAFSEFVQLRRQLQEEQPKGRAQADLIARAADARDRAQKELQRAVTIDPSRTFALVKLGDLKAWNGELEPALEYYGRALGQDPRAQVNHDWVRTNTKPERRLALYDEAARALRGRGTDAAQVALVEFYAALAQFDAKQWSTAKRRFAATVAANPEFTNAHYYAMLAAYWDGDHELAEQQGVQFATRAARPFADLLRQLDSDARDTAVNILEFLAARCFKAGRMAQSRDLNHVLAWVRQTAVTWNNYAFLCRETAKYEDSLVGYEHALELEPEDPQLLNDAAVILQYHLASEENLARAKEMYERAIRNAEQVLREGGEGDRVARARQAMQDARGNLGKMKG